jgi:two-component system sensor histidine kinase/response regulator
MTAPEVARESLGAILAVDDRHENLLALRTVLEDTGAELVMVQRGEDALAATLHREFAMAILDVHMPGMDGLELASLLRGDPKTRNLPIIFLTANSPDEAQIFEGYASGAVDYLVKPFNPTILQSKVRVLLELHRQRAELTLYREHLEELVAKRTEALERSNRDLEQFAYVASHDLREPLRQVVTHTQLLERHFGDGLEPEVRTYVDYAVEGATRMNELLRGLLAYSRVGADERSFDAVSLETVTRGVLRDLAAVIEESGAEVEQGELPTVRGDRVQLSQLLQNLIANALKFHGEAPARVSINAERVGLRWELRVRDNGIGIEPQYRERIFRIFQRLNQRERYPGSGIGLAIVKRVAERHGGEVRIEAAEGGGTCFVVSLPA